jgi:hypothetical protein
MASMKDLNSQKFEESWRKALSDGEMDPSPSVWTNIELDLMQAEGNSMKKKVFFYQWVAAASFFLVLFLGGAFYFNSEKDQAIMASANKPDMELAPKNNEVSPVHELGKPEIPANVKPSYLRENSSHVETDQKPSQPTVSLSVAPFIQKEHASFAKSEKSTPFSVSLPSRSESIASLKLFEEVPAVVHGKIVLPRLVLPAIPAAFMNNSKKDNSKEDLWASVGIAAGSYNPGGGVSGNQAFQSSIPTSANDGIGVGYSDPSSVGTAYSAGFALSKRVFSRWVLQSGVNYVSQNVGYTSNYVSSSPSNQSKAFVAEYADVSSLAVTITNPYEINSEINVVSLPLQTGYLIVDRKIGWQMNTGVAADVFVRNTLTDESGNLDRFSQGSGQDSPYRAVSWAGLFGTELSYKVARQYRISVAPSMRYSLNSILKSNSSGTSNPLVLDMGFRFRYIFK